ncbi:putative dehydrogenase with different specificities related to short-chain alcohol dehydrogenase [Operophtera brumata]|uniref:carbonyl reductase (NADPH) n=1 Tax=Operophtera brumata TaxID=104452 RepID=A0A0L7KMS8_OPEBR|nr:putative dehydrogenase with different specificities related to short-chain alcohol dehydrogenase [Operophtera brumata]
MTAKVAIVTGANKGIGFAIVRGLCKRFDGDVYLTSRDVERGNNAVEELKKEGLNPKYHQLDITDKHSLEVFRDYIKKNYDGIDVLVNNAAIAFKNSATEPVSVQAEQTLFVNYFCLVSACEVLFPLLKTGARVVNVSSSAGHLSKIPSAELRRKFIDPGLTVPQLSELMQGFINASKQGTHAAEWGNSSYAVSKVGVTAMTMVHQRTLADKDIKINAVHPGFVDTDMTSHKGMLTIEQGAEAPLYLALDAPDSIKGQFVWFTKEIVSWDEESRWRILSRFSL